MKQQSDSRRHHKSKSRSRPRSNTPSLALISRLFVACPRCGYFLSGYRARVGLNRLEAAIAGISDIDIDWLELGWEHSMLELLERSYGCEIPSNVEHFEERCEACARLLILSEEEGTRSLIIQVKPQAN